jgi:epsilon-lactone hydrolase
MPSPEHEAIVAALTSAPQGEAPTNIAAMREAMAGLADLFAGIPFPAGVEQVAVSAAGVPAFWFLPPDPRPGRAILYLHGGGYVMGSVATHRSLIARLALATGIRCLALDYRLAPEHPFPAAIEDACSAYHWLQTGIDPSGGRASTLEPEGDTRATPRPERIAASRIAIAGDSAGGGLVLGALVALRDAGQALPGAAVCISPLADLELTGESAHRGIADPMVSVEGTRIMAEAYLQGRDPRDPRASAIHADFTGFPPLCIEVGTREVLLDDATRVAERARKAGVDVELTLGEGLTHVWQLHPQLPEATESVARIAGFIVARIG